LDVFRVRLVVEDFPAALRFYATLMDGACVTKAPDVDAARIWTGRAGAEIDPLDRGRGRRARRAPGGARRRFRRDALVRAADGCLVEITKPQAVTLGAPLDDVA
jgi:hypothetical protein